MIPYNSFLSYAYQIQTPQLGLYKDLHNIVLENFFRHFILFIRSKKLIFKAERSLSAQGDNEIHFTDEETKAQRIQVTLPGSHS